MIHKLLLKLSVAVIAVFFTSQTVLAEGSREENRKGFFESLFGVHKRKKNRRTIQPWWKEDGGSFYGRNYYGDEDYNDPEPIPGKGMGNLPDRKSVV